MQPGKEDDCRKAIVLICDQFKESDEYKQIVKAVVDNEKNSEVGFG